MKVTTISVRIRDGAYLTAALRKLGEEGHPITAEEYDYGDIDSRPETLTKVLSTLDDTDMLVIWVSGNMEYFKNYSMMLKKAKLRNILTFVINMNRERADEHRYTFTDPDEDYEILYNYAILGGPSNLRGMGLWMLNRLEGENNELPEAVMPPAQGVYMKGCSDISLDTHIP